MRLATDLLPYAAKIALVLGILTAAIPPLTGAQAQTAQQQDGLERTVPFLTLRNRLDADDPADIYGEERNGLSTGTCHVRELDLGGFAPLAEQAPTFLREELLRVDKVTDLDKSAVLDNLQDTAAGRGAALYVHGYYIGFEKGCRRASLLQDNAGLNGRFLWFSWPSDGALAYYTQDEADLYWSVPDIADAIIELHSRFGNGDVDVIGHSLGARGVVLALYEVAHRAPDIRLGEVVLLAPDMDFGIFQRILPRILPVATSLTVYVSDSDRPLALSAQLHGYPRLGEAGNDVSTLDGVEVIDLSSLPLNSPTGHLYHIYSREVGNDLNQLLNEGKTAAARENTDVIDGNLWTLRPATGPANK